MRSCGLLTRAPSLSIEEKPGAFGMCIAIFKSFRCMRLVRRIEKESNVVRKNKDSKCRKVVKLTKFLSTKKLRA